MPELSTIQIVFAVLATLGCLAWMAGAWAGVKVQRVLRPLIDWTPALPVGGPGGTGRDTVGSLRVIVPARDEAHTLPAAAASLLAQDHPALELVLVDDRSGDETPQLIDGLAAQDRRVQAVHIETLPEGWLGKTHALQTGLAGATTDWLLFTDADVHFAPRCLSLAVAHAEERELDHLVLMPDMPPENFLLDSTIAAFGRCFVLGQKLWKVEDPNSEAFIGVGAFNLVRRSALEATEGFPWLALDVVDDVALGKMLKQSGARCGVALGRGLLSVRWYHSLPEMARGLEKNTFAVAGFRLSAVLVMAGSLLALDAAPLAALAGFWIQGLSWLGWLGVVALVSGLGMGVRLARWSHRPLLPALAYPIGTLCMVGILLRSGVLGALRGGISWRGTFHSSKSLRSRARVRFL